ncbi:hypothetical protein BD289DRAFT_227221 [Coniella lustricola]|uniref:Uncharacterized protein n=1 Tax=Coniella lustricola TaxID=2025994 RepID=A0A2T3AAP3_9PEZI|nr:hypothetical protein BD289DRAFT_227221 [Coniella lustricola]
MASLIPLLHDLLPMIIPSEVQIVQENQLVATKERAERPPWYQYSCGGEGAPTASVSRSVDACADSEASIESSHDQHEPIRLVDREEHTIPAVPVAAAIQKDMTDPSGGAAHVPVPPPANCPEVFRKDVMVGAIGHMCVSVLTLKPRSATGIRHFGEQDTVVHATTGHGVLLISPSTNAVKALRADLKGEQVPPQEDQPRRLDLRPGDFAFIPAWTEHQAVNEHSNGGDVTWLLMRNGSAPIQVELDGWRGSTIE